MATVKLDGLEVQIWRGVDGRLVVQIDGDDVRDENKNDAPSIRVWLNDALIYDEGETGEDLSQ